MVNKIFSFSTRNSNNRTFSNFIFIFFLSLIFIVFNIDFLFERDFFWDDLHFFRYYSLDELISVFYSHWDPDLIETEAYRPLATLLYHIEYVFFEENILLYRLFSLFLLIILQTIFSQIMMNLNCSFFTQLLTHFIFFASLSYSYMIIWATLSHILLGGIFSLLTLRNIIIYFKNKNIKSLIYAFLYLLIGLLIREEVYAIAIIIFIIGFIDLFREKFSFKGDFIKFVLGVFIISSAHYFLRKIILPGSSGFSEISIKSFYDYIVFYISSSSPGGLSSKDPMGIFLLTTLILLYIVLGVNNLKYTLRNNRLIFLLGCSIILSLPSLITSRVFSTFLPKLFIYALVIEILIYQLRNFSFKNKFIIGSFIVIFFTFSGTRRSLQLKESFSASSVYMGSYDLRFIFDKRATIPLNRRSRILKKYSNIKIPHQLLKKMDDESRSTFFLDKLFKLSKKKDSKYIIPLYHPLFP